MGPRPLPAPEPTTWFALAGEDRGHFDSVTRLVDRVCEAALDWFTPEVHEYVRGWRRSGAEPFWHLSRAFETARTRRLPVHGHFGGEPGAPQAAMFRAQLFLWEAECVDGRVVHVGFLARDVDRLDPRPGAIQAIEAGTWSFDVVLAFPRPEIEAWILAGFAPTSVEERKRLADLTADLGFSPVATPERLTSAADNSPRDAKRALRTVTLDDADRIAFCREAPLATLEANGSGCGLASFLTDVRTAVPPILEGNRG